jgi:protein gp37
MRNIYYGLVYKAPPGEGRPKWGGMSRYVEDWDKGLPKKGKRILFNCMGDLFHEGHKPGEIKAVLDRIGDWPQHRFIIPTKRPGIALYHLQAFRRVMGNVALMISVEDQESANARLQWAGRIKPYVEWLGVSAEPLIGALNIAPWIDDIGWVVCGAETGPAARKSEDAWHAEIQNACVKAGVPFFHKQFEILGQEIPI